MEREISFNVDRAPRTEVSRVEGSPEGLRKNKVSYFFLICLAVWTIFCVVGTWTFVYKHHFFFMEEAIFLTYVYTLFWALFIWVIPAATMVIFYVIFSK
jgi:hypothetical protein